MIFDGDVDPEWVENLNSLLDDNRLLTLPNGEHLSLPPNVKQQTKNFLTNKLPIDAAYMISSAFKPYTDVGELHCKL